MRIRLAIAGCVLAALTFAFVHQPAAQPPPGAGDGWNGEFDHSARQLTQLAEAFPQEKLAWRPGPGVRSTSELLMHIALGNHLLLGQAGLKPPDFAKLGKEPEKAFTAKAEVIKYLSDSFDAVRTAVKTADRSKPAKFFGKETTVDAVLLRLLVHNHEHMGQLIAYARANGVVPPWSAKAGQ